MRHKTIEEYIETIYVLEQRNGRAQTGMIAKQMGVKPPSITEMLQKLKKAGLIQYTSYSGAVLTGTGRAMARELMQKHRIIADLLETLGIERELAEVDACQIEHHVSARTVERLERFVEFSRSDAATAASICRFRKNPGKNGTCAAGLTKDR